MIKGEVLVKEQGQRNDKIKISGWYKSGMFLLPNKRTVVEAEVGLLRQKCVQCRSKKKRSVF